MDFKSFPDLIKEAYDISDLMKKLDGNINRKDKLSILKDKLLQVQKRIDNYGKVIQPRSNDFRIYLIKGRYSEVASINQNIVYYYPPKSFLIYLVGVQDLDFPILLEYRLKGKIEEYQIELIPLSEPII